MLRIRPGRPAFDQILVGPRRRGLRLLDILLAAAILGLLALLSAKLDRFAEERHSGRATVGDGDSLTLAGERIRLRGLDAPEFGQLCHRNGADYPCGRQARDALVELIGARSVTCAGRERDRYGRLLATCSVAGEDINRKMVELGWAVAYGDFASEERAARREGRGLWAGTFDKPRDWREKHGGLAESEHAGLARLLGWLRQLFRFG